MSSWTGLVSRDMAHCKQATDFQASEDYSHNKHPFFPSIRYSSIGLSAGSTCSLGGTNWIFVCEYNTH